jgi:transcriptional regulator with XRE-family HTH domain
MTDHQIVLARLRAERGESVKDLAASMGADQSTLGQYLTGKLGKKLPGPRTRRREKLKEADVVDIRWAWYYRHNSRAELADMYQVSLSAIKAATTGESWKHAGGPVTKPNTKRGQ